VPARVGRQLPDRQREELGRALHVEVLSIDDEIVESRVVDVLFVEISHAPDLVGVIASHEIHRRLVRGSEARGPAGLGGESFAQTADADVERRDDPHAQDGRVLTRTTILDHVWDPGFDRGSNLVEVYISYLRRKIDGDDRPPLLHTVRGIGYVLCEDGSPA
jgi:hypothetical protein